MASVKVGSNLDSMPGNAPSLYASSVATDVGAPGLLSLPRELLHLCCQYLDGLSRCIVRFVCSRLRQLTPPPYVGYLPGPRTRSRTVAALASRVVYVAKEAAYSGSLSLAQWAYGQLPSWQAYERRRVLEHAAMAACVQGRVELLEWAWGQHPTPENAKDWLEPCVTV
jgi:hypothetical protein